MKKKREWFGFHLSTVRHASAQPNHHKNHDISNFFSFGVVSRAPFVVCEEGKTKIMGP